MQGAGALPVTFGDRRTESWANVPTLGEVGIKVAMSAPYGIAGPEGMDPKIVKILHDAFRKAIDDPNYIKTIERLDQERWYVSTEDYAKYARETFTAEKATMERLGLKR